jgi:Fe-S cluster assembly iron-binding protein IscA
MMNAGRQGLKVYVDKDYQMMLENYMVDYYCEEKIGGGGAAAK